MADDRGILQNAELAAAKDQMTQFSDKGYRTKFQYSLPCIMTGNWFT